MTKYLLLIAFCLFPVHSEASSYDVVYKIINKQFPSYRLATEKDFQIEVIYGEWGKDKGITFEPKVGDLNGDSIKDYVFVAVEKEPIKIIIINGKAFKKKHTIFLACHGQKNKKFKCFKLKEGSMPYPLWWLYSITNVKNTMKCEYQDMSVVGTVVVIEPALGNIWSMYKFDGIKYLPCTFGD